MELAESLSRRGVEVILATLGGAPSVEQRRQAGAIPGLTLVAGSYKLEWMADPWEDVEASGRWLLELERRFGPEAIHLNSLGHGALPWRHPVTLTVHSCVVSWWKAVHGGPPPPEWDRYRQHVARSLRGAEMTTTPSRAMQKSVLENYRVDAARCRAIPNGRNAAPFQPGGKSHSSWPPGVCGMRARTLQHWRQLRRHFPGPCIWPAMKETG